MHVVNNNGMPLMKNGSESRKSNIFIFILKSSIDRFSKWLFSSCRVLALTLRIMGSVKTSFSQKLPVSLVFSYYAVYQGWDSSAFTQISVEQKSVVDHDDDHLHRKEINNKNKKQKKSKAIWVHICRVHTVLEGQWKSVNSNSTSSTSRPWKSLKIS